MNSSTTVTNSLQIIKNTVYTSIKQKFINTTFINTKFKNYKLHKNKVHTAISSYYNINIILLFYILSIDGTNTVINLYTV